jgi:hypothetical protein
LRLRDFPVRQARFAGSPRWLAAGLLPLPEMLLIQLLARSDGGVAPIFRVWEEWWWAAGLGLLPCCDRG